MCDCKSVVDTFQNFLEGRTPSSGLQEQDLWDEIFFLLSDDSSSIAIQWMPSHCSEPGNEDKLEKYLRNGTMCKEDVKGNDGADELAKSGANAHISIDHLFNASSDRRRIAILAQKMYVATWDAHILASDAATEAADYADIAEVERMMQAAQLDSIYNDEYDPFAEDEGEVAAAVVTHLHDDDSNALQGDYAESLPTRFPMYGWSHNQDAPDPEFAPCFP